MLFQNLSNNNYIFYYILRLIERERERERERDLYFLEIT